MKNGFSLKSELIRITPSNEEDLWEADWIIETAEAESEKIGRASFSGEKILGAIPLYLELEPRYRGRGLGTEALKLLVNWAFLYKNIYEIVVTVDCDNDKGRHALEKAKFVYRKEEKDEEDHKYEVYSIIKEKTGWTGIYAMIGVVIGIILGFVLGNMWVGFAMGMILCVGTGIVMDKTALHYRESVTGKKEQFIKHKKQ